MTETDALESEATDLVGRLWRDDLRLGDWWEALAEQGLAFPAWPVGLGGRGADAAETNAVLRALGTQGVIGPPSGVGQTMGGPTVLARGSDAQQRRWLPELAAGRQAWCQLFSEPGAGSDLAGLETSARAVPGGRAVRGQKVWSSGADTADHGLLLARSDPDRPKHDGLSLFVLDMDQPGVTARPLRQMNGAAEFCEVYLDDALVTDADLLGEPGQGWAVANAVLGFERTSIGSGAVRGLVQVQPGRGAGLLARTVGELVREQRARSRASSYVLSAREVVALARGHSLDGDPVIRQRLAHLHTLIEVNRLTGLRVRANLRAGRTGGPESSIGKLAMSNIARVARDLALSVAGPAGLLTGSDAPGGGRVAHVALTSCATSLGGGTDEIQRNVIAERVLGLPKDLDPDRGRPFRLRAAALRAEPS